MPVQFLRLAPRRSLILTVFLVTIHVVAALSVIPLTLVPLLKLGLLAVIIVSFVRLGAIHGWKTSLRSLVELTLHKEGMVTLVYRSGECCQGTLRRDTYVHPMGVILRVATATGDCRSTVLLRGQLEPGLFRCLRIDLLQHLREPHSDGR